jgi:hypothetical protein
MVPGNGRPARDEGSTAMTPEYMIGFNVDGKRDTVTVQAEDALIAALKVKHEKPTAVIAYVRKSNKRGDRRHPHHGITELAD